MGRYLGSILPIYHVAPLNERRNIWQRAENAPAKLFKSVIFFSGFKMMPKKACFLPPHFFGTSAVNPQKAIHFTYTQKKTKNKNINFPLWPLFLVCFDILKLTFSDILLCGDVTDKRFRVLHQKIEHLSSWRKKESLIQIRYFLPEFYRCRREILLSKEPLFAICKFVCKKSLRLSLCLFNYERKGFFGWQQNIDPLNLLQTVDQKF